MVDVAGGINEIAEAEVLEVSRRELYYNGGVGEVCGG